MRRMKTIPTLAKLAFLERPSVSQELVQKATIGLVERGEAPLSVRPRWVENCCCVLFVLTSLLAVPDCWGDSPDPPVAPDSVRAFIERSNNLNLNARTPSELDGLLNEYEELIAKSEGLAGVEWAMWDLARLYSSKNDSNADPVGDSLDKSIAWYRRAAAMAPSEGRFGLSLWRECQLGLVAQLHRSRDSSMLLEARKIIEDLSQRFPEIPSVQLRCKQSFVFQLIAERRLSDAERVVHEILRTEPFEPPELLHACKVTTINAFLQSALKQEGQDGVSDQRLQRFLDDYPDDVVVQGAVKTVREMRAGWTAMRVEPVNPAELSKLAEPVHTSNSLARNLFVAVNLMGLAVFVAILAYRRLSLR